jgi:hypothetical protein
MKNLGSSKYRKWSLGVAAAAALSFGLIMPTAAPAQVNVGIAISVHTPPPALPVYTQPPCPVEGYIWTPGYWAWGPVGYYWVPGVWVAPPHPGLLWTPGYWGFVGGVYGWHAGYWGPHVGYYGGINYGFGYAGVGFIGGAWAGGVFRYNSAVWAVGPGFHNVYVDRTVINNTTIINNTHVAFNGGPGGVNYHASAQEEKWSHENHFQQTQNQMRQENVARADRGAWASNNHGAPGTVAMDRVDGRRYDQQGRIAQGIHSGQLTAGETRNLESREAGLNNEIHNDREANRGHLTLQERQQVNQQQNNLSRSIYDDKHNANTAHYGNNEVGARRDLQQQRIANGVASGQLSPSETAHVEKGEQRINRQDAADRAANGGRLTPQEKRQINREQNRESGHIYNDKHNGKTAPK